MTMRFKILKYKAFDNQYELNPHGMKAWIQENDWNNFLQDYPLYRDQKAEFFVKIERHNPAEFTDFVIFCQLGKLPNQVRYNSEGSRYIWFPKELMPLRDGTTNKVSEVEVSIVAISDIAVAESITLNLKEDEVETWSEEEFIEAERDFRRNVRLCCQQQKFFFNRSVKIAVVGSINKDVTPQVENDSSPFWITKDTQIIIKGKPVNPKQVIDFSKIGGQQKVIDELRRMIQLPLNYPEYFSKFGINPPKGVLLYGPPGNGKTMIASAVAQSFGAAFIEIDLSDALQKYKGVGEYNIGKKFDEAKRKRNAVIFIDEIDAIASIRERDSNQHEISLVGKLLSVMDGIESSHRVFVIGATNRLYAIDPALRRPGRFDKDIEVPQPDFESRIDILSKYVKWDDKSLFDDSVNMQYIEELAVKIDGFSGADISALYTEASMIAIRRHLVIDEKGKPTMLEPVEKIFISADDFELARQVIKSTSERRSESRPRNESEAI